MLSEDAPLISPLLQSRTRAASVWLARSQVTASCLMRAMMGKSCVAIHSAAITFFDAVLLNHVSPSEARSTASDLLECGTP